MTGAGAWREGMKIGLHANRFHTCRGTCSWAQTARISPWHNSRSRGQCLIGIVITDCKRSATSFQIQTGSGSCSMVNDLLTNDKDLSYSAVNELTRHKSVFFFFFPSRGVFPLPEQVFGTGDKIYIFIYNLITISINCFSNSWSCSFYSRENARMNTFSWRLKEENSKAVGKGERDGERGWWLRAK